MAEVAVEMEQLPREGAGRDEVRTRWVLTRFTATLLGGGLVVNSFIASRIFAASPGVAQLSALLGALLLAVPILVRAVRGLVKGEGHSAQLVAVAVLACFAIGDYRTAGVVAFLMLAAELVQSRTALGAHAAIEKILRLVPRRARLILPDGGEEIVRPERLSAGDCIRIRAGERVAADGTIRKGESALDEATVTGESLPVDKAAGAQVFAGTTNLTGTLEVEVRSVGPDTTLGKVRGLILEAEKTRLPVIRMIDRYVRWYTPTILMLAGVILYFTPGATRAITALVFACPGALIMAAPTAMVAALSCAARLGILVKNVADLEQAGELDAVVFDKTGTLTTGRLTVTRLLPAEGVDPEELLSRAASTESQSNHPAAQAVVKVAREAKLHLTAPEGVREVAGMGVKASVAGKKMLVGRRSFLSQAGVAVPGEDAAEGVSALYVAEDGRFLGMISLEDHARPEARRAVDELKELGIRRLIMLTGDRYAIARRVSEELGCTAFHAECLPEQKLEIVEGLKEEGYRVAVVGDGVNDAPALAAGDIGLAMGAAGSDVAVKSATIALMSTDLRRVPFLVRLSRRTRSVVIQNLVFSLVFIVGGVTLSGYGLLESPALAAILNGVSGFVVIFSSARLVRYGAELGGPAGETYTHQEPGGQE